MADLSIKLGEIAQRWKGLRARDRLVITGVIAVVAAMGLFSAIGNSKYAMSVLFSNLSENDVSRIGDRLKGMSVPYQVSSNGSAILVPEDKVLDARMKLASEGLPSGEGVGFEIFDQQRFGESEFSEQVKYHRAIEGELARTISHLTGVQSARVHLVLPSTTVFSSNDQKASASIALHLKPGWRMKEDQVRGVVHLVASSVRGLNPENVIVVDDEGRRLSEGGDGSGSTTAVTDQNIAIHRQMERAKEEAAQQILDVALGPERSAVRVAANITFATEERTEEQYDPQAVATRSFQIVEERDGKSTITTGGVPGTVSNLPGGEAPLPGDSPGKSVDRRSETRNYEVTKVVRRAVEPVGRIQGLQVAVVVDGYWNVTKNQRKFTPRSKAELDRIKEIVASAVGLNATRGDRITIDCMPFAEKPKVKSSEGSSGLEEIKNYAAPLIPYLGGGVFVLLLTFVISYLLQVGSRVAISVAKAQQSNLALENNSLRAQALAANTGGKSAESEQIRLLSSNLANHEPEVAARVVRNWLTE
jgi:flagellar M-ring protein FliF